MLEIKNHRVAQLEDLLKINNIKIPILDYYFKKKGSGDYDGEDKLLQRRKGSKYFIRIQFSQA
jgi:hypothetical protein